MKLDKITVVNIVDYKLIFKKVLFFKPKKR